MSTSDAMQLSTWTSAMEAETILENLLQIWLHWGGGDEGYFRTEFIDDMREIARKHGDIFDDFSSKVYYPGKSAIIKSEDDKVFLKAKIEGLKHACVYVIKSLNEKNDSKLAWMYASKANYALGVLNGLVSGGRAESDLTAILSKKRRSEDGKKMATNRWASDPTRKAKEIAKECWDEWQKDPTRYCNQPDFANDVLDKVDVKENGKTVITFNTILKKYIPEWKRLN